MAVTLFAPTGYWCLTPAGKKAFCDGCGSGWTAGLVPDHLLGLDISECCHIHDYTYSTSEATIKAKESADRAFLNNMLRVVMSENKMQTARRLLAWDYYQAVCMFGGPAFWDGKNLESEEREI